MVCAVCSQRSVNWGEPRVVGAGQPRGEESACSRPRPRSASLADISRPITIRSLFVGSFFPVFIIFLYGAIEIMRLRKVSHDLP